MEQGLFEEGYRGKPNTQFAYAFYKKAIEHQKGGVREAHQKFGEYYQFGKHVNKNVGMAKRSMEEAAADGSLLAMNSLGSIFYNEDKDYYQAAEWFRKAADKGFTRAINNLGSCYEFGHGVKQDRDLAFKLYKEAAEKGYKEAMLNLAHMYFQNAQSAQNNELYKESANWYRTLIMEDPSLNAPFFYLGQMHEFGFGVTKDLRSAF